MASQPRWKQPKRARRPHDNQFGWNLVGIMASCLTGQRSPLTTHEARAFSLEVASMFGLRGSEILVISLVIVLPTILALV